MRKDTANLIEKNGGESAPNSCSDELAYLEALALVDQGRMDDYLARLLALAEEGNSCSYVYDDLSKYAEASGDAESALALLQEAQNICFTLERSHRQTQLYIRQGDRDAALGCLGNRLRHSIDESETLLQIKILLEETSHISETTWTTLVADLRRKTNFPDTEKVTGRPLRIAFVAQYASVWPSLRSVYRFASQDSQFSPVVILTPFFHPFSSTVETYLQMRDLLVSEGIPFCPSGNSASVAQKADVIFLQNPYDETRPKHLTAPALQAAGTRIAYVPYGLEVGGGQWNTTAQFDSPLQRAAWRIFARSEAHKMLFGKHCSIGNRHVVVTGHPKFDQVDEHDSGLSPPEWASKINGRKVILWTPHFSEGPTPAWSTFQLYGEHILEQARQHTDLFFLVRPHPLFFSAMLKNKVWSKNDEDIFRRLLSGSENLALDEAPQYHTSFHYSSALMADVGSFLLEYLPTQKPLLYLKHPEGLGMNDEGELEEILYAAETTNDITQFISMISTGNDPKKDQRISAIPRFLFGLDGMSGQRICEHIKSTLWEAPNEAVRFEQAP